MTDEKKRDAGGSSVGSKRWWSPGELISSTTTKATGILSQTEKISVRRRLTIVAICVVVFAAALSAIGNALFLPRTPEKAVSNYMNALQSGNYFVAIDRSAYGDESAVFLKNTMYRAAKGRIESYRIVSIHERGDEAVASVEVSQGGKTWEIEIPLEKTHRSGLVNDFWKLDYSPQVNETFYADMAFDQILVNDRKLKLKEADAQRDGGRFSWNVPLLPGEYKFSLPEDSYYTLLGGEHDVKVGLLQQSIEPIELRVRPSERMWSETNSSIESWLDRCVSSRSLQPSGCPGSHEYDSSGHPLAEKKTESSASATPSSDASSSKAVDIAKVEWKLVDRPALWLIQSEESPEQWEASKYAPATFELSYTVNGKKKTETIEAYIDATVVSSGNSASISSGLGKDPASSSSSSAARK